MPKISVLMATHNEDGVFLRKSIKSILEQTLKDFEFLIINDASNKKTSDILAGYAKNDARIKIIKNKNNLGLTKSLNIAIGKSQGDFIARMDSDDISSSDRMEKQLNFLEKNNYDLIGANCDIIDEKGNVLKEKRFSLPKNIMKYLIKGNFFTHSTFFGKRKIFKELYNKDFRQSQDYEFLLRILGKGYSIGYMPGSVLKYRLHQKGISVKSAKKQEWLAIKARVLAIKKYGYPFLYGIYIVRAFFSFLVPFKIKQFIFYKIIK